MSKLKSMDELFEGRHFDREVIILCVRWYLRYKLSLRDLVEMMADRGLSVALVLSICGQRGVDAAIMSAMKPAILRYRSTITRATRHTSASTTA